MPSPFPGMDPWLEHPAEWPGVHHLLISAAARLLNQQIKPRGYYVKVDERARQEQPDFVSRPDPAVVQRSAALSAQAGAAAVDEPIRITIMPLEAREGFLEVFDAKGRHVVTGIEFVSPSNKKSGPGREQYRTKRREWKRAGVNVVEVDLLRGGRHVLDVPKYTLTAFRPWHYLANIVRRDRSQYEVYLIWLRTRLPRIRIPLKPDDSDGSLDLQAALDDNYDHGPYAEGIDYAADPVPPLSADDAGWADAVLKQAGLRR